MGRVWFAFYVPFLVLGTGDTLAVIYCATMRVKWVAIADALADGTFYLWPFFALCQVLLQMSAFLFISCPVCHFDGSPCRRMLLHISMCASQCVLYWYRLHFSLFCRCSLWVPHSGCQFFVIVRSDFSVFYYFQFFQFFSGFHPDLTTCLASNWVPVWLLFSCNEKVKGAVQFIRD